MEQVIDVKTIREDLGLTQAQFGQLVGVDQSTVSNWEKGETRPRGPAIKVIESVRSRPDFLPRPSPQQEKTA
ncbi:helix-turn-helix domain-containing protein [Aquamicrobium sp.]|uniref:helix-turn-helix domain-containing protein n=1 Tax=Aquamicrobium sp. TaxID=1872579 RepID=UPI00349EC60F